MAFGKVLTGFSCPYVAEYQANGTTVTYSNGRRLARGVEIKITPASSEVDPFYADNVSAETAPDVFTGGDLELTVDGLFADAEQMILGLPDPTEVEINGKKVNSYAYGDNMAFPYLGQGFIARYQSAGVVSYTPIVLTKTRFNLPELSAQTQEATISWQTQPLTAKILRDDTAAHNWKIVGADMATEADAEAFIRAVLNITEAAA